MPRGQYYATLLLLDFSVCFIQNALSMRLENGEKHCWDKKDSDLGDNKQRSKVQSTPIATRKLILQQRDRANNISRILPAFKVIEKNHLTGSLVRDRLQKLHRYWAEFCKSHEEIVTRDDVNDDPYITESFFANHSQAICHNLHLPKIDLPYFTGRYEDWEAFENRFISLIHDKPQIPNVVKLQYLMGCLRDSAADFVKDVSVYNLTLNLIKGSSMKRESASGLRSLVDDITHRVRMLRNLGRPVDSWDDLLVVIICERLDPVSRKAWETYLSTRGMHAENDAIAVTSRKRPPTFKEMIDFLEGTIQALLSVEADQTQEKIPPQAKQFNANKSKNTVKVHHASVKPKLKGHSSNSSNTNLFKCPLCSQEHYIGKCDRFKALQSNEWHSEIRRLSLCFNCLGRHQARNCQSKRSCKRCQGSHHTMLHFDKIQDRSETTAAVESPQADSIKGSESTFISESIAQYLKLARQRVHIPIVGVGAARNLTVRSRVSLRLRSVTKENFEQDFNALVLAQPTTRLPSSALSNLDLSQFADLSLADPEFQLPGEIDAILGIDIYAIVLKQGLRHLNDHNIIVQNTTLGWIFSGQVHSSTSHKTENNAKVSRKIMHSIALEDLSDVLKRFWSVEEVPASVHKLSPNDQLCETLFKATHSRNKDGRYMVRLPLSAEPPCNVESTRRLAMNSFMSLSRRFEREPTLALEYCEFMRKYEELGHMSVIPESEIPNVRAWYLPHHAVWRKDSSSSKIRVVFDASRRAINQQSLNNFLLPGPSLQNDLPLILIGWR
ncbi:uncharacterized protein [Prorops nasuta]|uniref:uncharacterized protein n=1 Tax=Prorops nasuta TaxID=863751 RepID=UPI0034CF58A4